MKHASIATALGCMTLIGGCQQAADDAPAAAQVAEDESGAGKVHMMGAGPSSPVEGTCPNVTPAQTVTLTIKADRGNGDIFKQIGNRSLDFGIEAQYKPRKKDPNYWATDADISIGDQWTTVKFVLQQDSNDRIKFLRWASPGIDQTLATAAFTVEPTFKTAFCALSKIDTSVPDQESFTVNVKLPPTASGASVIAAYNLGFLANAKNKSDAYVPVFLDPNMKNEG